VYVPIFFLDEVCSYSENIGYHHQEDEQVASRGSISMKNAVLYLPTSGEKLRFEVHSTPSRGRTRVQKWYMKANHPVEASRWMQGISRAIEHTKQSYKASESDTSIFRHSGRGAVNSSLSVHTRDWDPINHENPQLLPYPSSTALQSNGDLCNASFMTSPSDNSFIEVPNDIAEVYPTELVSSSLVPTHDEGGENLFPEDSFLWGRESDEQHDASSGNDSTDRIYDSDTPPHESSFELLGNSTAAQLELTTQLLSDLSTPSAILSRAIELNGALKESLRTVQSMQNEYLHMAKERDDWWRARISREQRRQSVWEQSLQSVVQDGEALERELRGRSRRHTRVE
jgi:hypothetical protein